MERNEQRERFEDLMAINEVVSALEGNRGQKQGMRQLTLIRRQRHSALQLPLEQSASCGSALASSPFDLDSCT